MSDMCFKKCMGAIKEPDLSVGEMSCVDRCVLKYLEVQNTVGMNLREQTLAQQQQMQQMQQQ